MARGFSSWILIGAALASVLYGAGTLAQTAPATAPRPPATAPAAPGAAGAPAAALPGGGPASGIGNTRDRDQPIEITADNLELQRDTQLAIFRGNVEVVQGSSRMRADSMKVYYRERAQQAGARQQAQSQGEDIRAGKIARIEAFGKVFMSSDGETAQGDQAVHDFDRRILRIEGNVVLTRNSDVLSCARLTVNLDNKQNVCEGGGSRVKGVFNKDDAAGKKDKATN